MIFVIRILSSIDETGPSIKNHRVLGVNHVRTLLIFIGISRISRVGISRNIRNYEVFISVVIVDITEEVEERYLKILWIPFLVIISGVPFIANVCGP